MGNNIQISTNLVEVKNNQVISNSHKVADKFGKRHDHVLRDIDALMSDINKINALEGVPNFGDTPFKEVVTINQQNNQQYRSYDLNRDGFALLAMGYTGKEALKFKLAYINAFNAMEQQLSEQSVKRLETQQFLMIDLQGKYDSLKDSFSVLRKEHKDLHGVVNEMILRGDHPLSPKQQQRLKEAIHDKVSHFSNFGEYNRKIAFKYVWGKLYKAFDVPKYQLISCHQFDDALKLVQKLTKTQFIQDCPHAKRDYAQDNRQLDLFKHQVVVDMQESIELLKVTNDPAVKPIIINRIEKSIDKLNKLGFSKPQTITLK